MDAIELLTTGLAGNIEFLKKHLEEFSDADMLVRPLPNANHAAWQVGHACKSEASMVNAVKPGGIPALPAGFAEKFTKDMAKIDDIHPFPTKAEILDTFAKTRAETVAWAKTLNPADLDAPAPEKMRHMAPTLGRMLALMSDHVTMHLGQIQVIRRKIGRPIMF